MQLSVELSQEDSSVLSDIAQSQNSTASEVAASLLHDSLTRVSREPDDEFQRISEYVLEKDHELLMRLAK